jgi:Ran-binding protein 9/10
MATRPSRSASIPIPRSSSAVSPSRNIESVITIPFSTPGRRQPITQRHSIVDDRRGVSASYSARGSTSSAIATSPIRSTSRSMTTSHARGSPRTTSSFEPRIVRATTESSRGVDPACLPSSSTSPTRTRRPSIASGRAASTHRQVSSHTVSTPPPPPVSFARPAYLEHSALRHMLQTELPPALPPSRKTETATLDHHGYSAAMSSPTDSDEDGNVSPPRELPSAPPPLVSQDQIMRLPTRWSDQFRHALLTVSGDGRDLIYHGSFYPVLCGYFVVN